VYCQLKAKLLKIRLATIVSGSDINKKNKINRDLDKDTGGNKYEQDIFDMISEMTNKSHPGRNNEIDRKISKGMRNIKRNKKTGEAGFSFTL